MKAPKMVRGGCQCGAVSFEIDEPSLWCAHCHCTMCQRAHGAGFVTWVGYNEKDVEIHDTEGTLTWYASSSPALRGFCHRCGSMMFFKAEKWEGQLHIARASIPGDIDREPSGNAHFDTHVSWAMGAEDLPSS